jgi:ribosomal protein S18 acetylase RimI-like enzyme
METRVVQPDDASVLLGLMKAMQEDDPWSVPFVEERVRETVGVLLGDPRRGKAWFVCDGPRIVGYIVMSFDFSLEYGGVNAWVDEFFIEKESRGRGIGAQVLDFFERAAREAGATAIHLEVNHGNKAIELYRRRGFEKHQRFLMTKWIR